MNNGGGCTQKNKRLKEQRGRTKKLMFLCPYVKKANTHKNLCSFVLMSKKKTHRNLCSYVLMSKKKTHTKTYVLMFFCPKERITLLNHRFSNVHTTISATNTNVSSK